MVEVEGQRIVDVRILVIIGKNITFLSLVMICSIQLSSMAQASAGARSSYASYSETSYPNRVYWGDTHLHTSLSMNWVSRQYSGVNFSVLLLLMNRGFSYSFLILGYINSPSSLVSEYDGGCYC